MEEKPIRIEHVDGRGPWHTKCLDIYDYPELISYIDKHCYRYSMKSTNLGEGFPTPKHDGLEDHFNKECLCAYLNLDVFNKWVSKEDIQALISVGFKVYELELGVCFKGLHQVVFRDSEIKSKTDITHKFIN